MDPGYHTEKKDEVASIATLGDVATSITCSQVIAKEAFPEALRVGTDSFEAAAQMVKDGMARLLLVPGAYPKVGPLLMDEDLMLERVFKAKIPELVYGNVLNDVLAPVEAVYHHAAVTSLLPKVPGYGCGTQFIPVSSNEVAYQAMMTHGERAGCVTNKVVLDYFRKPSLMTLRTARDMAWLVFVARATPMGPQAAQRGEAR